MLPACLTMKPNKTKGCEQGDFLGAPLLPSQQIFLVIALLAQFASDSDKAGGHVEREARLNRNSTKMKQAAEGTQVQARTSLHGIAWHCMARKRMAARSGV